MDFWHLVFRGGLQEEPLEEVSEIWYDLQRGYERNPGLEDTPSRGFSRDAERAQERCRALSTVKP